MKTVAALYVDGSGPYSNLSNVEAWDVERDARKYKGPHPVVAHPPCKRWGNYWFGSPSGPDRFHLGDDNGCFGAALWAVRTFGGVLEHPQGSRAWTWYGLPTPGPQGWGWGNTQDAYGGRSCQVAQGHYGHPARKMTWLYAVIPSFPALVWSDIRGLKPVEHLDKRDRFITPIPFRDLLLDMVKSCHD